jgi:transposase
MFFLKNPTRKRGDIMKNDVLSTLFIGIDVSSKSNVVCAIDFETTKHLAFSVANNRLGATEMASKIASFLQTNKGFKSLIIALESTSCYSTHIATFLSSTEILMPYKPYVYCLNPKTTANYKKSYISVGKTDPIDAFIIADFARVGRITTEPWRGSQFLALQRLTRHRLHLVEAITREKTYMVSNVFLKFSELALNYNNDESPFSDRYGVTSSAILTEFLSPEDIVCTSVENLVEFVNTKSKNSFVDPQKTAELLKQAANKSYKLDKCLYEPITISIATSLNCINAFKSEVKKLDKAIEKTIKGINTNEYQSLLSIPGIGTVFAAGILAEIGSINTFSSHNALAKYAGIVWNQNQSGDFKADESHMSKAGNHYLRYYLIEATNSVKNFAPEFNIFYSKKYKEATTHHHKRALALTSRKLIRLIFVLLDNNQLYSKSVGNQN